ncbi:MAG: hypothetical protein [Inoviridae sp.]|nr:MAG: hypothetical protein [Inoviridae sp.]
MFQSTGFHLTYLFYCFSFYLSTKILPCIAVRLCRGFYYLISFRMSSMYFDNCFPSSAAFLLRFSTSDVCRLNVTAFFDSFSSTSPKISSYLSASTFSSAHFVAAL